MKIAGRVARLKGAEATEVDTDEYAVEALEEMHDIICGLPGLFDSESDDSAFDNPPDAED